jgi:hypothetical protein
MEKKACAQNNKKDMWKNKIQNQGQDYIPT